MFALQIFLLLFQNIASYRDIIMFGYPTYVICVTKSLKVSKSATCVTSFANSAKYDFAFYNSAEKSCCLTNYQYIFGAKNTGKSDVIGFRVDKTTLADSQTCPKKNPIIASNFKGGTSKFLIKYANNQLWISARACTGDIYVYYSVRSGKIVCWGFKQSNNNNIKLSVGTISQDSQFTSPPDLKIIEKEIKDMMKTGKVRKGAIPIDGTRKLECNMLNIMDNANCKFPNGYTFKDPGNPIISQLKFVNKPDFSIYKMCIIMLFDLDNSSLDMRLTFVSCSATSFGEYTWPVYCGRVL
ncbi:unnamed protein product [Caenorhabditis angaria]|uniref:PAN-3 domain-containing protein n=1 Tax=Caenorhabditis angaria TaxID=860376 RepID=A0A9P1N0L6_9PELO|nr:unnamed protein product [Caenorhabditis angaria]